MNHVMTYSMLGNNGKLGNQMFQYATLFAKAKEHSVPFAVPSEIYRDQYGFKLEGEYEILTAFPNLSVQKLSKEELDKISVSQHGRYQEPGFCYDPNFPLIVANVDLWGYFQSEMYFKDFRADILKEFTFEKKIEDAAKEKINEITKALGCENLCAIHLRRGDYLNLSDVHTNLDDEYYNTCINHMFTKFSNVGFVIFSDDIGWCKEQMQLSPNFTFSTGNDHLEDMRMMSLCQLHITANSSFSWWGAWMSESKCVLAPRQWFGPKGPPNWSTIYCENWLIA